MAAAHPPFADIITANKWAINYNTGANDLLIKTIDNTYKDFGKNITQKDMNDVVKKLTSGRNNSVLVCRNDSPIILEKLCSYFYDFINSKIITSFLDCLEKRKGYNYSDDKEFKWVEFLLGKNFEFTQSQLIVLSKIGYNILKLAKSLTYDEFESLLDNDTIYANISIGTDNQNIMLIVTKIEEIRGKFNVKLEARLLLKLLKRYHSRWYKHTWNIVLMYHTVMAELNVPFENDILKEFISNNIITGFDLLTVKSVFHFYSFKVDRKYFISQRNINYIVPYLIPELTSYDPIEDIFYYMEKFNNNSVGFSYYHVPDNYPNIDTLKTESISLLEFLVMHRYLHYDEFLMHLLSLGYYNEYIFKNACAKGLLTDKYHNNICCWGNYVLFNEILDSKFIPSIQHFQLCVDSGKILSLKKNSMYVTTEIDNYIKDIFIHQDSASIGTNMPDRLEGDVLFMDIYRSLSPRDKLIVINILTHYSLLFDLSNILQYDITLTKPYVDGFFIVGKWQILAKLLFISSKYHYIIEMIDMNSILKSVSKMGRIWFYNNILDPNREKIIFTYSLNPNFGLYTKQPDDDLKSRTTQAFLKILKIKEDAAHALKNYMGITTDLYEKDIECASMHNDAKIDKLNDSNHSNDSSHLNDLDELNNLDDESIFDDNDASDSDDNKPKICEKKVIEKKVIEKKVSKKTSK